MAEIRPITCAGCGLLCDDVVLGSEGLDPPCRLGAEWFSARISRPADTPAATINGQPADLEMAVARAAELLRSARRPLVSGFENATVEDARAAVALADRLGALVATSDGDWPGAPAAPLRGASTATLGEIRDRSQLVVIWREDPETSHPRLLERLGLGDDAPGRTFAVVDDRDTATARRAELRLTWPPEHDLEALVALHVLERGLAGPSNDLDGLRQRLLEVPHAAFIYGAGLVAGAGGQRRALALHELVRALSHERHVVTLELPRAPGTRSADDVLAWQAGYSGKVDFAGGHPELVTATAPLDDVDVKLLVAPGPAGTLLTGPDAEVSIRTAAPGVEARGTAHRLDGVPLALQAPQPGEAPTAAAVLTRVLAEVEK
jgi:formylmethanofuran dehydrogenase subunit B